MPKDDEEVTELQNDPAFLLKNQGKGNPKGFQNTKTDNE